MPDLKKHIARVHDGEKNFSCDHCDLKFFDTSNLKRHVASIHEGLKNHVCEICGKSFFCKCFQLILRNISCLKTVILKKSKMVPYIQTPK